VYEYFGVLNERERNPIRTQRSVRPTSVLSIYPVPTPNSALMEGGRRAEFSFRLDTHIPLVTNFLRFGPRFGR
jgi:hypothetical protein